MRSLKQSVRPLNGHTPTRLRPYDAATLAELNVSKKTTDANVHTGIGVSLTCRYIRTFRCWNGFSKVGRRYSPRCRRHKCAVFHRSWMMFVWGEYWNRGWGSLDFQTGLVMDNEAAARMLLFYAHRALDLRQYWEADVVRRVEVVCASDSCPACRKLNGHKYSLDKVPELPHEKCTSEMGCRCVVGGRAGLSNNAAALQH